MNKKLFFFVLILVVLIPLDLFANGKKAIPLSHFVEGITKVSDNGFFSIEVVPEPVKSRVGKNKVKVYLHDAEGKDLEGAIVTLEIRNKDKGTISKVKPKTKETAHGEYVINDVIYDSNDVYELIVNIKNGDLNDKAVFEIKVAPAIAPDMSTTEQPQPHY